VWTFTGGGVVEAARPAAAEVGGAVRSTLTVSPDRSGMTASWERSSDSTSWQPWMILPSPGCRDPRESLRAGPRPFGRKQHWQHRWVLGRRGNLAGWLGEPGLGLAIAGPVGGGAGYRGSVVTVAGLVLLVQNTTSGLRAGRTAGPWS
jgi:hypothetical protein